MLGGSLKLEQFVLRPTMSVGMRITLFLNNSMAIQNYIMKGLKTIKLIYTYIFLLKEI